LGEIAIIPILNEKRGRYHCLTERAAKSTTGKIKAAIRRTDATSWPQAFLEKEFERSAFEMVANEDEMNVEYLRDILSERAAKRGGKSGLTPRRKAPAWWAAFVQSVSGRVGLHAVTGR